MLLVGLLHAPPATQSQFPFFLLVCVCVCLVRAVTERNKRENCHFGVLGIILQSKLLETFTLRFPRVLDKFGELWATVVKVIRKPIS